MKRILTFIFLLLFLVVVVSPQTSFSQSIGGDGQGGLGGDGQSELRGDEEVRVGGVSGGPGSLTNPLKSKSIQGFFLAILDILLVFAIPIVVLFIMWAGFLYVTARGDEKKISTAHAALTWSIIGGVIILGAKLIIEVIQNTVDAL